MNPIDLTERVAVVTGRLARHWVRDGRSAVRAGSSVVLNSRKDIRRGQVGVRQTGGGSSGRTSVVYGSVAESATASEIGKHVQSRYKRLDILVNNAGILRDRLIGMIPDAEMEEVFDVNVFGVLRLTQLAAQYHGAAKKRLDHQCRRPIVGRRGNVGRTRLRRVQSRGDWRHVVRRQGTRADEHSRQCGCAWAYRHRDDCEAFPKTSGVELEASIGMGRARSA